MTSGVLQPICSSCWVIPYLGGGDLQSWPATKVPLPGTRYKRPASSLASTARTVTWLMPYRRLSLFSDGMECTGHSSSSCSFQSQTANEAAAGSGGPNFQSSASSFPPPHPSSSAGHCPRRQSSPQHGNAGVKLGQTMRQKHGIGWFYSLTGTYKFVPNRIAQTESDVNGKIQNEPYNYEIKIVKCFYMGNYGLRSVPNGRCRVYHTAG